MHGNTIPRNPSERGFSIVELMIASIATMAILAATFTILNMTFMANASMQEMLETQQAVRVAINTIARDITMAGTGLPGSIAVPNNGNPPTTGAQPLTRPGLLTDLPTPTGTINMIIPGEAEGPLITGTVAAQNTDAITVVAVDQQSPIWSLSGYTDKGTSTGVDADFVEDVRTGTTQLFVNDVLLFTNANGAVLGCVTAISTTTSRASFDTADGCGTHGLNQPAAPAGIFMTTLPNPDLTLPPTTAVRVQVISYYLATTGSHGHPSLIRAVNAQTPQGMIEGVEDLQFTFDLYDFVTATASANVVPAPGFNAANQIRSVNITVNGRSPQPLRRTGDYYRFGLTSKVNVRNATFRNRYNGP